MKTTLKREDIVTVVSGDDRGKVGKVIEVLRDKNKVIVEGVAMVKKHVRKSQDYPEGAIVEKFMPVHISNVMLKSEKDKRLLKKNKNA